MIFVCIFERKRASARCTPMALSSQLSDRSVLYDAAKNCVFLSLALFFVFSVARQATLFHLSPLSQRHIRRLDILN